jgi:hypothetical protein
MLRNRGSSARQAPYHTIPPSGEAVYVIDGLLYHEADLSIGTHHTDGGAVGDHNFALAYLLGLYFAPRIPQPGRAAPLLSGYARDGHTVWLCGCASGHGAGRLLHVFELRAVF